MSNSNPSQTKRSMPSRPPSHRDLQIFRLAEIQGLTHQQIAATFKVSRRRIGQIVKRVSHWLSQNSCEDPQIATELERNRLGQHIERMRLEDVIWRARIGLTAAPQHLTTTTTKADGSQITVRRELPPRRCPTAQNLSPLHPGARKVRSGAGSSVPTAGRRRVSVGQRGDE